MGPAGVCLVGIDQATTPLQISPVIIAQPMVASCESRIRYWIM